MKGKIVVVTGATDGIGRQTALELVRLGARVVVHGRARAKVDQTIAAIAAAQPGAQLEGAVADLASPAEVVAMAAELSRQHPRLDVLINNAGVFMNDRQLDAAGVELTFRVNHLAPMLLTHGLLGPLTAAGPGRVVNVSSIAHNRASLELADLRGGRPFDGYAAYAGSKLANVLFTYSLADRYAPEQLSAFALHPGVIDTKLLRTGFNMRGADLASGARTSVYCASSPELAGQTGLYFQDGRKTPSSAASRDKAARDALWAESCRLLGLTW
jgi:NAD(P)-dependent dehydrogenase (short-subunit alcohol dehydrogenase family)